MKKSLFQIAFSLIAGFCGAAVFTFFFGNTYHTSNLATPEGELISPEARYQEHLAAFANNTPNKSSIPINADFTAACAVATPTVVFIKTVSNVQRSLSWSDLFFDDPTNYKQLGSGSGVILSSDGYIVTNNHVIDKAETIEVVHQKRSYTAKVIGRDPNSDLAVLKVEAKGLPFIKVGDSKALQVGEWVIAVGNPFNLTSTVTTGVVSAKGRNLNILNSLFPIESFIQTDAAINPGNSGGALVNLKGELVGINTAIYSKTGTYNGYGFAVPTDIVQKIVKDLIKYGDVQKAFFGAEVMDITQAQSDKLELPNLNGVLITDISPEGAASKAGLKKNDVILKIENEKIDSKATFDEEISYRDPGQKVRVSYRRGKNQMEALLTLTNSEGSTGVIKKEVLESAKLKGKFETISKVEKDKFRIPSGLRILKLDAGSVLRNVGFRENFIVVSINNKLINNITDLEEAMADFQGYAVIGYVDPNGQYNKVSVQTY